MTIQALRGKSARAAERQDDGELPIGEPDANIFGCPSCARPLGVGTTRCPGCSTRLIRGVRATRATEFLVVGLLIGLVVGGTATAGLMLAARPAVVTTVDTAPLAVPSQVVVTSAPVASAPAPVAVPQVPAAALSALSQSALLNERLVTDAARLTTVMAATNPSSVEIAKVLRALAASAAFGDRIAPDLAAWPAGAALSADLVTFYAIVGGTARDGLAASLTNTRAYVDAGRAMLAVMAGLPELDAAARSLATSVGAELPPSTLPADAAAAGGAP